MASSVISNPVTNSDRSRESSKRKKKKKNQIQSQVRDQQNQNHTKWKSQVQQQLYSSKLLQALRQVRLGSSNETPRRGRAVREAADRALAVAAKGRTRWSRAILTNRLKLKFMKHKRQRVMVTGQNRSKKPKVSILRLKGKNLPGVQRKVRFLGRLVPGCRKLPLPDILEEATDYIAALEMQVRAMTALTELLSGSTSSAGARTTSSNSPADTTDYIAALEMQVRTKTALTELLSGSTSSAGASTTSSNSPADTLGSSRPAPS